MTDLTRSPSNNTSSSSSSGPMGEPARVDEAVQSLKSNLTTSAHDLGYDVKHLAGDVVDQTKKSAASQLDLGKSRAVEGLGSVATALRKTGDSLRADDNEMLTGVIDGAAQRIDSASSYLKDKSFTDILVDMKDFARREPALFLGGALVAGLLGGRFLKASTPSGGSASTSGGGGYRNASGSSSTSGSSGASGSAAFYGSSGATTSAPHRGSYASPPPPPMRSTAASAPMSASTAPTTGAAASGNGASPSADGK